MVDVTVGGISGGWVGVRGGRLRKRMFYTLVVCIVKGLFHGVRLAVVCFSMWK